MRTATKSRRPWWHRRKGVYGIAPLRGNCGVETCDLCALDVFSGGDPTAEVIRVTVTDFASAGACTPAGGSGAGALLGSTATPIDHDCTYSHDIGGCPVYTKVTAGTGFGENGTVQVFVGPASTLCGSTDCAILLIYNPAARLQRIYKYTGSWVSCSTAQTGGCTPANSTVGIISTPPIVL